jgi:hypothetical protein
VRIRALGHVARKHDPRHRASHRSPQCDTAGRSRLGRGGRGNARAHGGGLGGGNHGAYRCHALRDGVQLVSRTHFARYLVEAGQPRMHGTASTGISRMAGRATWPTRGRP